MTLVRQYSASQLEDLSGRSKVKIKIFSSMDDSQSIFTAVCVGLCIAFVLYLLKIYIHLRERIVFILTAIILNYLAIVAAVWAREQMTSAVNRFKDEIL